MNNLAQKLLRRKLRKNRVRKTVIGTTERPRLSVFISNRHISAQVIDDSKRITLVSATTVGQKNSDRNMSQKAHDLGKDIALKAKKSKINQLVFDRNGRLYHGRLKVLADSIRQEGIDF